MSDKIKAALAKLDPTNDNHWTADGFPRLDTVRLLASDGTLSREAVTNALPGFSRTTATKPALAATVVVVATEAPAVAQPAPAATSEPAADLPDAGDTLESACAAIVAKVNANLEASGSEVVVVASLDEHGQLKLELAEAKEELDELRAIRDEVVRRFTAQNAKVDKLIVAVERTAPKHELVDSVQGYLARQRKNLEERGRRIRATAGINLKDFLPTKAPCDIRPRKKS